MTRVRPSLLPLLVPLFGCPSDSNSTGGSETTSGDSTAAPSTETIDPTELTGPTEPTTTSAESSSGADSTTAVVDTTESGTSAADESSTGADSTGTTGEAGIADIVMSVVLEDTVASVRTEMRNFADWPAQPGAAPLKHTVEIVSLV